MTEPWKRKEVIGDCTLYLGDCLEILPTLEKVDAVITDPPYGIGYQSNMRTKTEKFSQIHNDDGPFVEWIQHINTDSIVCFYRFDVQDEFINSLEKSGYKITGQGVWHKPGGGIGDLKRAPLLEHELYLTSCNSTFEFKNGRPMSVQRIKKVPPSEMVHPTEKPRELIEYLVKHYSINCVLDPFMGSGTTGVACVNLGRKFIGIEIEPKYFEIALQRIKAAQSQGRLFA